MRILIVEDDERIVGFMKRGLEAEDFKVDVALGTSQAFDLVNAGIYDLLIIDIFLGPDDGLDLCQTLRQRRVGSPILIMTAKGTPETEKMSKEAGADAYLAKPFAFEDLIATINRLYERSAACDSSKEIQECYRANDNTRKRIDETLRASSNVHGLTRNEREGILSWSTNRF